MRDLSRSSPLAVDWPAPVDVRIEGDAVTWDRARTETRNGRQQVNPGLLERFAALARDADLGAAVLDFVLDFGPLGVDSDGRALSAEDHATEDGRQRMLDREAAARQSEPLASWYTWSERVAATLPVASALISRRKVSTGDLERFGRVVVSGQSTDGVDLKKVVTQQLVAGAVTGWLYWARVGVGVNWRTGQFAQLSMAGGGAGCLPSVLLQLALTMTRAESVSTCSGCGLPFTPNRIAREGRRSFCEVCRSKGVPQKLAARDLRHRRALKGISNG